MVQFCDMGVYEIMWKNMVEPDRPQMTIWRMRIACWIIKGTDTHTEYVIFTAFPVQQWLKQRVSVLRYTYNDCLVCYYNEKNLYVYNKHGIWRVKCDFRCLPLCRWNLLSSCMLSSTNYYLCRSNKSAYLSFFQEVCITLQDGTDRLYRNVAK